jgi:hypothetical protein
LHELARRAGELRLPLARAAAVLLVTFQLALAAAASEEAGFATDRGEQFAAETWTDVALGELAPRSAILVRSRAVAWRLWAARVARGERPDVVVIPVPLLDDGRVATSLIAAEPEVAPLVRTFSLTGQPTEHALSRVADVRKLYVEYDPVWSKRLASHLRIDGLWLEYASQPLGPSDRKQSTVAAGPRIARVLAAILAPTVAEAQTGLVVGGMLRAHADVLDALGDHDAASLEVSRLEGLLARDPTTLRPTIPYALKGIKRSLVQRGISSERQPPGAHSARLRAAR